jgi:hypothetical protein
MKIEMLKNAVRQIRNQCKETSRYREEVLNINNYSNCMTVHPIK